MYCDADFVRQPAASPRERAQLGLASTPGRTQCGEFFRIPNRHSSTAVKPNRTKKKKEKKSKIPNPTIGQLCTPRVELRETHILVHTRTRRGRMMSLRTLPHGTKHVVAGLLIGTVYGMTLSLMILRRGKGGLSTTTPVQASRPTPYFRRY